MKQTYWLWICDACGEQHQYAGFCDFCQHPERLMQVRSVPVPVIKALANGAAKPFADYLASLPGEPLPRQQT